MLNIRTFSLSVTLVVILTLTVGFVGFRKDPVYNPSNDPAGVLDNQERSTSPDYVDDAQSYRYQLGECFDLPLTEFVGCRHLSLASKPSYRSTLGECFDVSLQELRSCHYGSLVSKPSYRSTLGECFDVSLQELSSCRNLSLASKPSYRSTLGECFDVSLQELSSCREVSQFLTFK
jgi:hypothetical protein